MPQHPSWISCCAALGFFNAISVGAADDPKPREPLQSILDRIRQHTANDDWRRGRFEDKKIQTWIDSLVADAARIAGKPGLKVPIHFSDIQPIDPFYGINRTRIRFSDETLDLRATNSGLLICKNARLSTALNAIVLCDGDIWATRIVNSVVISRGSVHATVASNSVIVAGTYVHVSASGRRGSAENGNVIISRGWADIADAQETVIAAQEGAKFSKAEDSVLINVAKPSKGPEGIHTVLAPELTLGPLALHPVASKIEFVGLLYNRERFGFDSFSSVFADGLVFRYDDRQYVASLNEEIVDEFGHTVTAFAGWKLKYISDEIAILRKDDAEAVVRIADK